MPHVTKVKDVKIFKDRIWYTINIKGKRQNYSLILQWDQEYIINYTLRVYQFTVTSAVAAFVQ